MTPAAGLVGGQPEQVWTGAKWTEGPCVLDDGSLLFSDIPNNRILRLAGGKAEVWKQPSNFANGRTLDRDGSIVTCEHGGRRVVRYGRDGSYAVVVDAHEGRKLNSPNDVVVAADGAVWFTDPPYGIESNYEGYKAESEQTGNHVYRFDPAHRHNADRCRRFRPAERVGVFARRADPLYRRQRRLARGRLWR